MSATKITPKEQRFLAESARRAAVKARERGQEATARLFERLATAHDEAARRHECAPSVAGVPNGGVQ